MRLDRVRSITEAQVLRRYVALSTTTLKPEMFLSGVDRNQSNRLKPGPWRSRQSNAPERGKKKGWDQHSQPREPDAEPLSRNILTSFSFALAELLTTWRQQCSKAD